MENKKVKYKKTKIAIIDTGASLTLPFTEDIFGGIFFSIQENKIYASHDWSDQLGHGSMVCSIIKRYCPDCLFYIVKIYDKQWLTSSVLLLQALEHLLKIDIDIINVSLSVSSHIYEKEIKDTLYEIWKQGKMVLVAVENGKRESFPANYQYCYGVKSVKKLPQCGYYLKKNNNIEIFADGYPEYVEEMEKRKRWFSGNSKATAKMTGIIGHYLYIKNKEDLFNINNVNSSFQKYKWADFINQNNNNLYKNIHEIVRCMELCKNYCREDILVYVLRNLNIEVSRGEAVAILGKNKTVTTEFSNILLGKETITSGSLCIDGYFLENLSSSKRNIICKKIVKKISNKNTLENKITVYKNIIENSDTKFDLNYVECLLDFADILDIKNKFPQELSDFQQKKVMFIKEVVKRPALILVEEPLKSMNQIEKDKLVEFYIDVATTFEQTIFALTNKKNIANKFNRIIEL